MLGYRSMAKKLEDLPNVAKSSRQKRRLRTVEDLRKQKQRDIKENRGSFQNRKTSFWKYCRFRQDEREETKTDGELGKGEGSILKAEK